MALQESWVNSNGSPHRGRKLVQKMHIFGFFSATPCNFSSKNPKDHEICKLSQCTRPISSHLKRVGLKTGIRGDFSADVQNEGILISARVGIFSYDDQMSVCPFHRDSLGLNWYQPAWCVYPQQLHSGAGKPVKTVTLEMSRTMLYDGHLLQVGSGIFIDHFELIQCRPRILMMYISFCFNFLMFYFINFESLKFIPHVILD